MQCPRCFRKVDESDSFCSGCDYCFVCEESECECPEDKTILDEVIDERNKLRDEVAELKRDINELVMLVIKSFENFSIEGTAGAAKSALEAFMLMKLNSPVK